MGGIADKIKKNLGYSVEEKPMSKETQEYWKSVYAEKPKETSPSAEQIRNRILKHSAELIERKGDNYINDDQSKSIVNFVSLYLAEDKRISKWLHTENLKCQNKFSFKKGVLLAGSYGLGKSMFLEAAHLSRVPGQTFGFVTANMAVQYYEENGPKHLSKYFSGNKAFDDLGTEEKAFFYGKRIDIFKTILEERYNSFTKDGVKTHATTNLTIEQLGDKYGKRVESRAYEMFNIIYLTGNDRRK